MKKNILIVCNDNVLYSKLAEAYLKKYAGHWKNIFSAGLDTKGKKVSPYLKSILAEDQLETSIDDALKSIEEYETNSFDYIIALTSRAFEYCKKNIPEKELVLFVIQSNDEQNESSMKSLSEEMKSELLKFVKNGPIKKWVESN